MKIGRSLTIAVIAIFLVHSVLAQASEFSYQGLLQISGVPANGNYDFEFRLFDAASGGIQIGSSSTRPNVVVTNGLFITGINFGLEAFTGADRYMEIWVRPAGQGSLTILSPRIRVHTTPYAITSINTLQLGGTPANQYVLTTDPRLTDARPPTAGSSSYIQNQNSGAQPASNFNISGSGTAGNTFRANIVHATTEFRQGAVNGLRVLRGTTDHLYVGLEAGAVDTGFANTFVGPRAGFSNTTGHRNSFFGQSAGILNVGGADNSFFGSSAGGNTTTGSHNSFFGSGTGISTVDGNRNSFFGSSSGGSNVSGAGNSFFGYRAGHSSVSANNNSFFGSFAGENNTTGHSNAFFGGGAGQANTTGQGNSFFGQSAGGANTSGDSNSYFGHQAGMSSVVTGFNSFFGTEAGKLTTAGSNSFFGSYSGKDNTTGGLNSFFGAFTGWVNTTGQRNSFFGMNAGRLNDTGSSNSFFGYSAGTQNTIGQSNSFFGDSAGRDTTTGGYNSFFGVAAGLNNDTGQENIFIGTSSATANTSGSRNAFIGRSSGQANTIGTDNTLIGYQADLGSGDLTFATAIGAQAVVSSSNTIVLGRSGGSDTVRIPGRLALLDLGSAGNTQLCRNGLISGPQIASCSSSYRYKTNIGSFARSMDLIMKLRPITFDWKDGGMHDLGLGAEDVAAIEPLLVTYNKSGQVEGVKYDRIGVVLVNAVKEQQAQIESLRMQLNELRKLVCIERAAAAVCKEEKQ